MNRMYFNLFNYLLSKFQWIKKLHHLNNLQCIDLTLNIIDPLEHFSLIKSVQYKHCLIIHSYYQTMISLRLSPQTKLRIANTKE